MVAFILVIVGGLNWLLVGLINFDLVMWLFVDILGMGILAKIVYILVGLAALYELMTHKKSCNVCSAGGSSASSASMSGDVTHG